MNSFENQLNNMLVHAYRSLELMEEKMIRESRDLNLTISEIHLLDAVGPPVASPLGRTVSEISESLAISLPSATLAINKLVTKGYVTKQKSSTDGRMVYIRLTRAGQKAEHAHRFFHRSMIRSITKEMNGEEQSVLLDSITKLTGFFDSKLHTGGTA